MRHFTLILSVLLPLCSWATNLDSLLHIYQHTPNNSDKIDLSIQISEYYIVNGQYDTALTYASKAAKLAQMLEKDEAKILETLAEYLITNNQFDQADSVLDLALTYPSTNLEKAEIYMTKFGVKLRKGDIEHTLEELTKAREYIGDDTTNATMGRYLANMGVYYTNIRMPLNSMQYLLKAKQLFTQHGSTPTHNVNHNLSVVYQDIEAYDLALELSLENQKTTLANKNYLDALFNYFSIATTYFEIEEYPKSKATCLKAIELRENHHVSTAFGYAYYILGLTLVEEGKIDSAIYYFQEGIALSEKQGERKELSDNHRGMCLAMLRKNDLSEALYHGKLSEESATYFEENLYLYLAEIYERKGNYSEAFQALKKLQDFQAQKTKNNQSYKLISTLLSEKFKAEQQEEQKKFEHVLSRQKVYALLILVGLGLIFLFVIMYVQAKSNQKLRKLNKELEDRNHDLNQFTYITSHDLKEPIRNIRSFSGLLERQLDREVSTSAEAREYLGYITNGAQTLYKIVEALRVYTKISNGEVQYETLSLPKVFNTVKDNLNAYISDKNGQLVLVNPHQINDIYFSEAMLQLILQNLVQNGFKHNDSDAPIVKVLVEKIGKEIMFKITDNGKGISSRYFDKIFQPFQTLQNKSTTQSSGLGLAICKNILLKFGKDIHVESDGQNGSSFYFSI